MNIVFFGTSDFGIPSLEALSRPPHRLLAVVSTPDKAQGRNLEVQPSPVKKWALSKKIEILEASVLDTAEGLKILSALNADCFVVIAFGKILKKAAIDMPKLLTLNVHASLLPRYRGAAPIHWAILNSDKETGVSIMRMIEKLDAGDVLLQKKTPIGPREDILSLDKRLSELGRDALVEALSLVEKNKADFAPQKEELSSYARKIKKEDGLISWNKSVNYIDAQIRALKEWPSSYTFYEKKRIIILEASISNEIVPKGTNPGTILRASSREGLFVAAADGVIQVFSLKPEGRKALEAKEFLKGSPLKEGGIFE